MDLSQKHILIVDDEEKIRDLLSMYLREAGFLTSQASGGQQALDMINEYNYNLVILDLMMPGIDGLDVCRKIRQTSQIPVIILTAKGDEFDKVLGLEMGADDYIVKPFSPREVVARVKAVLRRSTASSINKNTRVLRYDGLIIDADARAVAIKEVEINLTPKEFDLLYFIAQYPGKVFSREQLLRHVWDYDYYGDLRTVDTHVNRLRDKLNKHCGDCQYIHTVWGVGYKFEVGK
ncbi:response regulator transcription factor [Desulfofalx alkaliphila]|uniref:response regulator transcription factor n=1 Tax=Desulfofalx alkaliphila TaxID=105483 RepID=UPI0004E1201A|nr:response regulator transcription factor [Desulfofalx alkaliphila]